MKDPKDCGRWEGATFVFEPPITVTDEDGNKLPMRSIDTSVMQLPPDVTPDDVISALLNPVDGNSVFVDEPSS